MILRTFTASTMSEAAEMVVALAAGESVEAAGATA